MELWIFAVRTQVRRGEQNSWIHWIYVVSLNLAEWDNQRVEGSVRSSTDRLRFALLGWIESLSLSFPEWSPSAARLRTGVKRYTCATKISGDSRLLDYFSWIFHE